MGLKNKESRSTGTLEKIQKVLSAHGANRIMYDYDNDGKLKAITFALTIDGQVQGFRMDALVDNVYEIMYAGMKKSNGKVNYEPKRREQAYNTAWANIRDWIDAQMALVATRQVKIQQVFLPYRVMKNGQTLSENIEQNPALLLGEAE